MRHSSTHTHDEKKDSPYGQLSRTNNKLLKSDIYRTVRSLALLVPTFFASSATAAAGSKTQIVRLMRLCQRIAQIVGQIAHRQVRIVQPGGVHQERMEAVRIAVAETW